MTEQREIALSDAAQRLGISWERTWRLLLTGRLRGEKRNGRWFVSATSVELLRTATAKLLLSDDYHE